MARHSQPLLSDNYFPTGGDPYPAPIVPLPQRILMLPVGMLLRVVSSLPSFVRRGAADILAFTAYSIVRYRRTIVSRNIADCFPELNDNQRRDIEHNFYRNLADYFFQTAAIAYSSPKRVMRHISFSGLDQVRHSLDQGHDITLYTSHFGNWEYIPTLALYLPDRPEVVYAHVARPLKNLWFNRFFHRLRSRFNTSVPMRQTARTMLGWRRDNKRYIIGFLSDQKPGHNTKPLDVEFLGRITPFIEGTEELAHKLHNAVFYTDVERLGRDRFHVTLRKMADDASLLPAGALTQQYATLLTETIRRNPASYLWSHNRWRLK